MDFLSYRHAVNMGDLISALAGVRHLYETTGKKAVVYQQLNRPGEYYPGAQHPTKDNNGSMVCFNEEMFSMMRPLLISQTYIKDFLIYNGEKVNYDLDVVRLQVHCGAPHYPLQKWAWAAYPEMSCDLSDAWVDAHYTSCIAMYTFENREIRWWQSAPNNPHSRIIVNFTDRYRNNNINYFFLKKYEADIVFTGTEEEHNAFCKLWRLNVPRLIVTDFMELAMAIKGCRFFLGCQSFCWNLAEAMKVPRILELSPYMQNCTVFGANGHEYFHQHAAEHYVNKLYNQ